ncbi:patatin-like phospholipase family protein [Dongia mobilis]|uniref:patatin-like phospholipase family protein n=1 Tax=Dongia sp. TaxID=1977262 RepID=UPI0026E9BB25
MPKIELPAYETVALVLQGGGALGSYQAGVYEGLHEAGIQPNWFAGISIGALNAAILGGNAPEKRLEKLNEFWETICQSALFPAFMLGAEVATLLGDGDMRTLAGAWSSMRSMVEGQRGFFTPRLPPPFLNTFGGPEASSFYDTAPLKATLERLVDFDRINSRETRVSVGAVNVETGNFEYFDNANRNLQAEHFMASGALPPGFPAVEIEGKHYWDGGLVSNTPLMEVISCPPRRDTLTFQVDLWSAKGQLPQNLLDVDERRKYITYSSRTRLVTDVAGQMQRLRHALRKAIDKIPADLQNDAELAPLRELACSKVYNTVQLIYRDKQFETHSKDYEFSLLNMREHWQAGLDDIRETLKHPEWLARPSGSTAVVTHDVHRVEDPPKR